MQCHIHIPSDDVNVEEKSIQFVRQISNEIEVNFANLSVIG